MSDALLRSRVREGCMDASGKRDKPGPARRRKVERSKHRRRCRDARRGTQLPLGLALRKVGGKRRGAGRKLQGPRRQVPHRRRPDVYCTDAVHVTWRFLPPCAAHMPTGAASDGFARPGWPRRRR